MRRLFGKRDEASHAFEEVGPPPSSALTRWLRQGIELGICPLCQVAHKADREYIWQFSEAGFGGGIAYWRELLGLVFCLHVR